MNTNANQVYRLFSFATFIEMLHFNDQEYEQQIPRDACDHVAASITDPRAFPLITG